MIEGMDDFKRVKNEVEKQNDPRANPVFMNTKVYIKNAGVYKFE